jgi:hypothetical protein
VAELGGGSVSAARANRRADSACRFGAIARRGVSAASAIVELAAVGAWHEGSIGDTAEEP